MLFQELLNEKYRLLKPQFDKLYEMAFTNQTHPGDLLLVHQNGFYNPEVLGWNNIPEKLSPYMMGPDIQGHSENTHHSFIGNYVTNNINNQTLDKYLNEVSFVSDRLEEVRRLEAIESLSVQTEMLIYLKIWEADAFIKTFYELALVSNGQAYNWYFKIKESNRDKTATGNRDEIIRKLIRDQFEHKLPVLYNSFKSAFKTQIRNAIAHSQYIINGRHITLNNYVKDDMSAQLRGIPFNQWIDIFHETIIIYSLYNELLTRILNEYAHLSAQNGNAFEIRINIELPEKKTVYRKVEYDSDYKYWR